MATGVSQRSRSVSVSRKRKRRLSKSRYCTGMAVASRTNWPMTNSRDHWSVIKSLTAWSRRLGVEPRPASDLAQGTLADTSGSSRRNGTDNQDIMSPARGITHVRENHPAYNTHVLQHDDFRPARPERKCEKKPVIDRRPARVHLQFITPVYISHVRYGETAKIYLPRRGKKTRRVRAKKSSSEGN